jgi:hypothetical protein
MQLLSLRLERPDSSHEWYVSGASNSDSRHLTLSRWMIEDGRSLKTRFSTHWDQVEQQLVRHRHLLVLSSASIRSQRIRSSGRHLATSVVTWLYTARSDDIIQIPLVGLVP